MKKAVVTLSFILLASCLLPIAGYYLALAAQSRDAAAAWQTFWVDAAQSGSAAQPAPQATAAPSPAASALPTATPAPQTAGLAADAVLVQDSSSGEVLTVPLRDYLIGAVASEMPMAWADAALQAQAVAVHTYVLYCRDHNDTSTMGGAWLAADPARRQGWMTDPVLRSYWGTSYDANYARLSALVDEVLDTVVTYQGQPAATSYFALSNGRTEASQNVWSEALPYLQGVDSSADKAAEGYACEITYTYQQMYDALVSSLGLPADQYTPDRYFSDYVYTDAGYVDSLTVCGASVKGTVLRSALHLRSACFSIGYADTVFTITTYGYGHGVGLSQAGAQAMAQSGSSWQDILQHYFPGTTLTTVALGEG